MIRPCHTISNYRARIVACSFVPATVGLGELAGASTVTTRSSCNRHVIGRPRVELQKAWRPTAAVLRRPTVAIATTRIISMYCHDPLASQKPSWSHCRSRPPPPADTPAIGPRRLNSERMVLVALAAAVVVLGGGFVTNLRRPERDPPREPVVECATGIERKQHVERVVVPRRKARRADRRNPRIRATCSRTASRTSATSTAAPADPRSD